MAIDWIYDTTYVSFGVDWDAAYKAVGKVTIQPRIYRWDRYTTYDSSSFDETLRYEPNGSTGSWSVSWGGGSGTRNVDTFGVRTYERRASAYTVQLEIETSSGFGTAYDGYYHTIGVVSRTATYTVPALPPAFNTITATRVSDNQVNLSWTAASGNIEAVCIERSVDGGSFSEVAVIWSASATSWQDTATTSDHSYTYRARYHHGGAYGPYSNTVTVTMTPSAPQAITTAAIQGSTNVAVELGNASPVATSLEWQSSTDGGQTWSASTTVSGSPVTSFTATGISGTAYIRVRNVNAAGASDWLVSEQVTTICPPAAPTLTAPSGNVVDMASGSVTFSWLHNSLDGSSQTAAQLAYSTDGGSTWTTQTLTTEQSYTISPIPWAAGTAVTWRVRTKGADPSYGDWAQARTFNVYTAPTLSITSPGATITGMPIALAATYSDMAGFTCQAATVSLTKDGRTLYTENATINGTSITSSLDVSEFLPTNGETYTVVLTARSSSGLQTTANATFLVDFTEPHAGELQITNDPETGYVSLLATFDNSASEQTYSGETNEQYESEPAFVKSLEVQGQSILRKSKNLIPLKFYDGIGYNKQPGNQLTITDATGVTQSGDVFTRSVGSWGGFGMISEKLANGTYKLSGSVYSTGMRLSVYVLNADFTVSRNLGNYSSPSSITLTHAPTLTGGECYVAFHVGSNIAGDVSITAPQLEAGTTATAYEEYFPPYIESISSVSVGDGTITTDLRSAGTAHDELQVTNASYTVERNVGVRTYQSGDESDSSVITDGTTTYYELLSPTTDTPVTISIIEIGSDFTVATDLDSTFEMTTWDGSADAVSISVSRVNADGTITPLLTDGASGSGLVDRYAPLNTPYQYAVSTKASSQAVKTVYVDNIIESDYWFAYWGENVASAKWNPDNGGIQVTRPSKTRVYYAGRRDPVSYDGHAVALTETPSWMFINKEEVDLFVKLIEDGGRGIYKSCDGWVYHADFDLTLTPSYTAIGYYGGASLGITRIAGEKL